jgi:DNA modification methylase
MRWLIRLVTRPGGVVLDPFAGSGTTGCAAALEGMVFRGVEMNPEYATIARARIEYWASMGPVPMTVGGGTQAPSTPQQLGLFG